MCGPLLISSFIILNILLRSPLTLPQVTPASRLSRSPQQRQTACQLVHLFLRAVHADAQIKQFFRR